MTPAPPRPDLHPRRPARGLRGCEVRVIKGDRVFWTCPIDNTIWSIGECGDLAMFMAGDVRPMSEMEIN